MRKQWEGGEEVVIFNLRKDIDITLKKDDKISAKYCKFLCNNSSHIL